MSTLVELFREKINEISIEDAKKLWDSTKEDDKIGPKISEFFEFSEQYCVEKKRRKSNIVCTNPSINQNIVSGFFIHKKIVKNYDSCSVLAS